MSQVPPNFERSYSFTDFSVNTPNLQQPGNKIDQELNNVRTSLNATIARLSEIQYDNGTLKINQLNIDTINAAAQASADAAEVSRLQAQAARNDTYTSGAEIAATKTYVTNIANGMNANNAAALASIASSISTVNGYVQNASNYASAAHNSADLAAQISADSQMYANQASGYADDALASAQASALSAAAAATSAASAPAIPTGGSAGQVLAKIDGTDYHTQWINQTSTNALQLSGGLMNQGALIDFESTDGKDSELGAWGLGVEDNTGHTATFEPQQIRIYDSTHPIGVSITSHGITFPDGSTMASSAVSVDLSGYLTTATAAATYLSQVSAGNTYATIASPTFTGDPKAPTPATSDNDTSIATTAFVKAQGYAPLASPTFTGTPAAPTATSTDNSTKIATTAFVKTALSSNSASFYTQGKNVTGATLPAFAVVYITGTNSGLPTWGLAQANSSATSDKTFGVLINAITNNGTGVAITAGMISNINTAAWTVGTQIWLSPTTAGGLTSTRPASPNHSVYIGTVIIQNASSGQIFVRIQNGYQLEDLHNVTITSPANNQSLFYDSATSTWVNRTNDPGSSYLALTGGTMGTNASVSFPIVDTINDPAIYGGHLELTSHHLQQTETDQQGSGGFELSKTKVSGSFNYENGWELNQNGVGCITNAVEFGLHKDRVFGEHWSVNANSVSGIDDNDNHWSFSGTGASTYGQINIEYGNNKAEASSGAYYAYQTNNGTNPSAYGVVYTGGFEAANGDGQWIEFTPTQLRFGDGSIQTTAATGGGGDYLPLAGGTMTGNITFDGTSGQYIGKGTFDTSRGGNYGLSLVCSIGYELNWQAGWLTTTNQSSTTPRSFYLDSLAGTTLKAWDSSNDTGIDISHTAITFSDSTNCKLQGSGNDGNDHSWNWSLGNNISDLSNGSGELVLSGSTVDNGGTTLTVNSTHIKIDGNDGNGASNTCNIYTNQIKFDDNSASTSAIYSATGITFPDSSIMTTAVNTSGLLALNENNIGGFYLVGNSGEDPTTYYSNNGITFTDSTVQSTAGIPEAPIDGNYYVRKNGAWYQCTVYTLLGKNYLTV